MNTDDKIDDFILGKLFVMSGNLIDYDFFG